MKSKLPLHFRFLVVLCLFFASLGYAQVKEPFNIRYPRPGDAPTLRGDLTVIGNNIVNRAPANDPYSGSTANDRLNMQYINVDPDPGGRRFSSSSAVLQFPQANCNNIVYAGLYWGATYVRNGGNASPLNIQMKLPTNANYVDITGTYVFDGASDPTTRDYSPYIAYADVTNLITAQADPTGEYTVANVRSTLGRRVLPGGVSGGWTLVVIYENPLLKGKKITTFDGFAVIRSGESATINYSGFETIPSGPVRAQLGVGVLEGDRGIPGDRLSISAASNPGTNFLSNAQNPVDNFFNGSISINGAQFTNRTPNSLNTLGWDLDLLMLNNPANSVLPNNETSAAFSATSSRDKYDIFFNSFNVEIIEPDIRLHKIVEDLAGNDISGDGVTLGQDLEYVLTFQNRGNDHATGFQIRDPLPINVNFNDIAANLDLPPGVTWVYDNVNHEIIFNIPDNLVEENGAEHTIRINVRVVDNCFELRDACSNLIQNLAYSTYRGVFNNNQITDDPSVSAVDACGFVTPGATNFLVDLGDCDFTRTENLCGERVTLTAGNGFDSYEWRDQNGNIVGNTQNITVNEVGTYTVTKTAPAPCLSFDETVNVVLFGTTQTNPILPVADEVVTCPNDGDDLPKIFLCGASDTRLLETNISDATSIVWEKLDEGSCAAITEDCANKNSTCTWNQVATGDDFNVGDAGEYRLVINYQNGCFSRFYFKVFVNTLDPLHNFRDIICNTDGNITITNVPGSYEFQLIDATNGNIIVPYQNNPSFDIASPGIFTVEIRQQGVNNGCIFRVSDIGIRERNFDGNVIVTDESCTGDLGSIRIQAVDALPQYSYAIFQGVTVVDT
ncbi:MAG: hypothetical protein OIF50_00290, partial [Flavobacteriaceae bacterium]|nr:hypothetical protein [Flavobacteriaceae bacterium]